MALKKDLASLQNQLEEVKLIAADDKEEVRSLKAEYKALKKDVEELRCKNAYPSEGAKSVNDVWGFKSVQHCSRETASANEPCGEKQEESSMIRTYRPAPLSVQR